MTMCKKELLSNSLAFILCFILSIQLIQSSLECGNGAVKCSNGCDSPSYIQGCTQYKSKSQCAVCQYNYQLKNGACIFQPNISSRSCQQFDYNGQCKKCIPGLFLDSLSKQCTDKKLTGCLQKTQTGCINCAKQFKLLNSKCIPKLNGCNEYNNNGSDYYCSVCEQGFDLIKGECSNSSWKNSPNPECIPPFKLNQSNKICSIQNCKTYFEWGCIECNQGYDLSSNSQCILQKIPGCIDYLSENQCKICEDSLYQMFKGVCYPFGCLELNQNFECQSCNSKLGFVLYQGHCTIPYCKYAGKDGCNICQQGRVKIRNQCLPENLLDQTACVTCPSTHFLNSENNCQKKEQGCLQYAKDVCSKCQDAYVLNSISRKCIKRLPGCIYNEKAECLSCQKNYKYDVSKGYCYIIGCNKYSSNGRCSECIRNFKLTFENFCNIDNCLEINDDGCVTCVENYQVDKQGSCSLFDPHCIAKNIYGKCIGCHDGFYIDSTSTCKQAKLGCNYVDGLCTSCKTPFTYNKQTSTCFVDGCKQYFFGGCQTCQQGYGLRYNSCKLPHCLISQNGKCLQCDPDYIMRVKTNQCINKDEFCYQYNKDGQCIECAPKYFMSKLQHKCLARQPGCIYDDQDKCSTCFSPFKSIVGQNKCYISGCLQHNLDNCKQCRYPFNLTDTKFCTIQNCLKNDDEKCVDCFGGYILQNGLCTTGDSYCVQYNFKSGQCLRCKQGYKIVNNKCQYEDAHCQSFTSKGHCENCQRLYFLNPLKQCELRDSNCQQYTNGYCTKCKPYFYYFDSLCYQNSKGCLAQSSIDKCEKCQDGFKLQNNKCIKNITQLNWNSIDMDWFSATDKKQQEKLNQTFTAGKQNKINLQPCLKSGYGKLYYSSDIQNTKSACVSSEQNGWQPKSQLNEFVGVQIPNKETFYAIDIKCLPNNKLTSFIIEYVDIKNSSTFKKVGAYDLSCEAAGVVKTIYFTPVEAYSVRLKTRIGIANIQVEFYYNNKKYQPMETANNQTIIQKTIRETVSISHELLSNYCKDKELCWFGLQVCEPRSINGFFIQLDGNGSQGKVKSVYVDYSIDGIEYNCYNQCRGLSVSDGGVRFSKAILGSKMRVHIVEYEGQPNIKVRFDYN